MTAWSASDRRLEHERDETLAVLDDAESFVELYRRYLSPVYAYCYARLLRVQDAEDVTSAVFERAWRQRPAYRAAGSYRGWLFAIAHHTLVDHVRARGATASPLSSGGEALPDTAPGPEEMAIEAEAWQRLRTLMRILTPEQSEVLTLWYAADLPLADVAAILGKSQSATKMLAHRAVAALRRRYPHGLD